MNVAKGARRMGIDELAAFLHSFPKVSFFEASILG